MRMIDEKHSVESEIQHEWQTCQDEDCEECTALIEQDFLMACDECGHVGLKEVSAAGNVRTSWFMQDNGLVLCEYCDQRKANPPA